MSDAIAYRALDLRVESVVTPLGVESTRPRLSWRLDGATQGTRQIAYQIFAATTAEGLDRPDLWDSGVRSSANTLDIPYEGPQAAPCTRIWWRVKSWDQEGRKAQADSWWETGLLTAADWSGRWIAIEAEEDRADREAGLLWVWGTEARHEATRKFRFRFSLDQPAEAVVAIGGRDRLDGLWIDGRPCPVLRPADIDFVQPPMTEATASLEAGEHVVTAEVSFNPHIAVPPPTGRFCALLRLRSARGTVRLTTPIGWKTTTATVAGWQSPGFDDTEWEGVSPVTDQPTIPWQARPAMLARREFTLSKEVRSARLHAAALGAFVASVNGQRVGDALLAPEYADFRGRVPYRIYDVGRSLQIGANVVGFHVGDGWFGSACAPQSRFPFMNGPRQLLAQLEVEYADGTRAVIGTDESWHLHESPVLSSEIYDGEHYDARCELPGWDQPGREGAAWPTARLGEAPAARPTADITPPIRVTEVLKPRSVTTVADGVQLFDFGQNHAGVPRLRVDAPAGTVVTMRFAELVENGRLDPSNLRAAKATDTYVCSGDSKGESYQPHFTFHGYRYAEVQVPPGCPPPSLESAVVHSDLPLIASLEIKDAVIEGIWRNALWSQRSNFVSVPTDCPQRDERLGWTGDAMVFWDAATLYMDVTAFTRRYLQEVRFAQAPDGAFPVFAPSPWKPPAGMGPTPGWADAGIVLPWMTWRRSGDTAIVEENWEAMQRYLAGIAEANPEMRWLHKRGADFGDWLSVDSKKPGDAATPKDLIATALWAADCAMMADMAKAIGRDQTALQFRDTWQRIVEAFRETYVAEDGTIGNGSQTSYILPLYFGLLTPAQARAAATHFAASVRARGTMLTTGFIGTPFALHALADHGHGDLAIALLRRTEFPSWGYMLSKGATTMWERWNSDTGGVQMNSYNHYAFGAVSSFLMRRIVGIDSAEPGFRRIRIRPLVAADLGAVAGSLQSPLGRIATRWLVTGNELHLSIEIPANATAEVHLPGTQVTESNAPLSRRPEIRVLAVSSEATIMEVDAGRFEFGSILTT